MIYIFNVFFQVQLLSRCQLNHFSFVCIKKKNPKNYWGGGGGWWAGAGGRRGLGTLPPSKYEKRLTKDLEHA